MTFDTNYFTVPFKKAIEFKFDYPEAWINRGNSLYELDRKEEAIVSYEKAIEFKPDCHEAWFGRASCICSTSQNTLLKSDIAAFIRRQNIFALSQAQPHLFALKEALPHFQKGTIGSGKIHQALGDAQVNHAGLQTQKEDWREAICCYKVALSCLPIESHALDHLEVIQALVRTLLRLNAIPAARHYQTQGSHLYEALRKQAVDQRTFEAKFSTFRLTEIDLLIGENEPARALEQAEFYKNRALTWLFDNDQEITLSPTYDRIRSNLTLGTAIVYWHQSTDRITTFILTNDNAEPIILDCDRQQQHQRFILWKDKWDKDYDDYRSKKSATQSDHPWRQQMRDRLKQLAEILEIDAIEQHLKNTETLILIPHRDLHRYPIHALFDRPTTHAPSLQSIDRASHPAPADRPSLLTIADPETPTDPMPYALLESALLQSIVRASHPAPLLSIISPEAANLPTTLQSLKNSNHTHFHFTGHGIHNSQFPNRSALQLKNGLLTASTISQLDLNHQHLAILAACETAIVTTDDTSDYIGIQSAFLRAGTRTILSTLWNIDEIASTWFIIHFYKQILNGEKASIALRATQTWMQTLTWEELYQWITNLSEIEDLTYRWRKELHQSIEDIQKEQGKINDIRTPYANPYYWAAFTLVGAA